MMGIGKNVVNFLGTTMKSSKVELTCGAETIGEVPTKEGFFKEMHYQHRCL